MAEGGSEREPRGEENKEWCRIVRGGNERGVAGEGLSKRWGMGGGSSDVVRR